MSHGRPIVLLLAAAACADPGASNLVAPAPSVSPSAGSANRFAGVRFDGVPLRGNHVTNVGHVGTGQYEITFDSDVSRCAYLATTYSAQIRALLVFPAGGNTPARVFVETRDQNTVRTDATFDLIVICDAPQTPSVVVGYNGKRVRGSASTSVVASGGGQFRVTFPMAVDRCAYLASVADPGNGLVPGPAIIETMSGPTPNTVDVETRNTAGTPQAGIPFHLVAACPGLADAGFVVVAAAGGSRRGFPRSGSTFRKSIGQYVVTAPLPVTGCAKVVTRGSVNTAPVTPATLEAVNGTTSTSFQVREKQLAVFGAPFVDGDFHALAVC